MSSPQLRPRIPPTGLPVGVEAGPLGRRLVAHLIDLAVPAVVIAVANAVVVGTDSRSVQLGTMVVAVLLVLLWALLVWRMFARRAAGPGMRLMKLQLVGLKNGRPIGWGRFFVRSLVLGLLEASVVGVLVMLVFLVRRQRKQGWHDLAVTSVVIKQRSLAPATARQPVRAVEPVADAAEFPAAVDDVASESSEVRPVTQEVLSAERPVEDPRREAEPVEERAPVEEPEPVDERELVEEPEPVEEPELHGASVLEPSAAAADTDSEAAPAEQGTAAPLVEPVNDRSRDEGWTAELDDGRRLDIAGPVLLGRNPRPGAGEDEVELVTVADETRTVSKTHLAIGVDAQGLYVVDRGSTNGSTVTDSSGVSRSCPSGELVPVEEGSIVSFGDHWLRIARHPDR